MSCVLLGQGQEFSSQTVSGFPGGAAHSAGVGQRGAATTDHQPGRQLCIWPVWENSALHHRNTLHIKIYYNIIVILNCNNVS